MLPQRLESVRELTSWKEIAEFLDVSVRTAQRYEREYGLPVRRLEGEKGRAVVARVDDLEAWKRRALTPPRWWESVRFLQRYAVAATAAAVLLLGYVGWNLLVTARKGHPHQSHWVGSTLVVTDDSGEMLWRKTFDEPPLVPGQRPWSERVHRDLDGDGQVESLVPHATASRDSRGAFLYCFSPKGEELWRIQPKRAVSDQQVTHSSIYVLRDFAAFPSPERDGTWWVAAIYAHHYEYPAVLVVVDGHGRLRGEYWHSGHFDRLLATDLDEDGTYEILAAGVSHSNERATIVVFDPRHVAGAEVMPPGHIRQLRGFGPGTEKATIFFGRSRLSAKHEKFNYAHYIGLPAESKDRSFQVYVNEFLDGAMGYLIYTIRPDLTLDSVSAAVALERTYSLQALKEPGFKPFGPEDIADLKKQYLVVRPQRAQ